MGSKDLQRKYTMVITCKSTCQEERDKQAIFVKETNELSVSTVVLFSKLK